MTKKLYKLKFKIRDEVKSSLFRGDRGIVLEKRITSKGDEYLIHWSKDDSVYWHNRKKDKLVKA